MTISRATRSADRALAYLSFATPIGRLGVLAEPDAVIGVWFDAPESLPPADNNPTASADAVQLAAAAQRELTAYCTGRLREFTVPIAPRGTAFQCAVWNALLAVPYGKTAGYRDIAAQLGNPGASRAVGAACGANPLPLIIPCHRILTADRGLGGFGGGLPVKRWLLELELLGRPPRALRAAEQ